MEPFVTQIDDMADILRSIASNPTSIHPCEEKEKKPPQETLPLSLTSPPFLLPAAFISLSPIQINAATPRPGLSLTPHFPSPTAAPEPRTAPEPRSRSQLFFLLRRS